MDLGDHDDLILPVPPESFARIAKASAARATDDAIEASLRRMGLQPVAVAGDDGDGMCTASPRFWLRLGEASALAGPAADVALDVADPNQPSRRKPSCGMARGRNLLVVLSRRR